MSMETGTNYSGYQTGNAAWDTVRPYTDRMSDHAKELYEKQKALKPELDAWKKRGEGLRGSKAYNGEQTGAVYEKSADTATDKVTYSIAQMNKSDRASILSQLKAEQQRREGQLTSLVSDMLGRQASVGANAGIWRALASGKVQADPATRAQAQKDISEDGYWGVKKTSQRLFDFAQALAGDDVEQMKKMEAAMEKGFKKAEKAWGGSLPSICGDTMNAARGLFADYYASKGEA